MVGSEIVVVVVVVGVGLGLGIGLQRGLGFGITQRLVGMRLGSQRVDYIFHRALQGHTTLLGWRGTFAWLERRLRKRLGSERFGSRIFRANTSRWGFVGLLERRVCRGFGRGFLGFVVGLVLLFLEIGRVHS